MKTGAAPSTGKATSKGKAAPPEAAHDATAGLAQLQLNAAPVFTADSLSRAYSFLLGTHPRAGVDSPISKLPLDAVRKICERVRQPLELAPTFHFAASDKKVGTIDLWCMVTKYDAHSRFVLQHTMPSVPGAVKAPVATRYLGRYGGFMKFMVEVEWTHKKSGVARACPPYATAEELRAAQLKLAADTDVKLPLPKGALAPAVGISCLAFEHGGVTIERKTAAAIVLAQCSDSVGTSQECYDAMVRAEAEAHAKARAARAL